MEPTQFFTDAFVEELCDKAPHKANTDALADAAYDEDPQPALLGLDKWKVPESIFRADGSCMSIWELARANGYHFEGDPDVAPGSAFDNAFLELGVDPVIGPATEDHLELDPESSAPIVVDYVTPRSTCANQLTVYPLDTLNSLENADLGPPLSVVQVAPATDAPITKHPPVIIDQAPKVAPVTAAAVSQVAPFTPSAATGTVKVFALPQGKSSAKRPPKQRAKRVPKNKQDDELHKKQKKTKAKSTPLKAKGKTTLAPVTPPQKIAPAPMTPKPAPTPFPTSMTPIPAGQQQQLQLEQRLRNQEQYLRIEWKQLQQQQAHLKRQPPPGDPQQLQIYEQQRQLHEQQFKLCQHKVMQHKEQVRQYRHQQQQQCAMQQSHQFQAAAAQQVQQPTHQMQAVYPTPPKERMQSVMQQSQRLQASAAQRVQQPIHQKQAVYPTPPKERMQSVMHETQEVYPSPPKERMQTTMQQTQRLQASGAQQAHPPTQQMQGIYSTPTKERKQSVSSLSAASTSKRTFEFMESIVPSNFVANPNNHARWTVSPNGDRTYLNGPQTKKARVSTK
ncbi:unnamed protein product [Penicillium egyptiacum]|uniref:Uncharacterized protein n=1 Tax=Penicillium egyptiacum TaxID=1303716 RepID=A0A9W4KN15_9EURO|nr:unnamed protein product [Penicillium egyptiacum]